MAPHTHTRALNSTGREVDVMGVSRMVNGVYVYVSSIHHSTLKLTFFPVLLMRIHMENLLNTQTTSMDATHTFPSKSDWNAFCLFLAQARNSS